MTIRSIQAGILMAAMSFTLAACGSASPAASGGASAAPTVAELDPTCAQVSAHNIPMSRTAWDLPAVPTELVVWTDGTVLMPVGDDLHIFASNYYDVSGKADLADWACGIVQDKSLRLSEAFAEALASQVGETPTCSMVLSPPAPGLLDGLATAATKVTNVGLTGEQLQAWCATTPNARLFEGTWLADQANAYAAEFDAAKEAQQAQAAKMQVVWTTVSQLGFTYSNVLTIGTPSKATNVGHPADSSFTAGTACAFDPSTDAYIPLTLSTTNSTNGFASTDVSSHFNVVALGKPAPQTVTLALEANFSSGADCVFDGGTGSWSDSAFGVQFTDSMAPGASGRSISFLILHNFYSPRFPSGNTGDLAAYVIEGAAYSDDADPVVTVTSDSVSLDGSYRQDG